MPMNVSATPGEGIVPEPARDGSHQPTERSGEAGLSLEHPTVPEHQPHQGHQFWRRPVTIHEGLAEADVVTHQRPQKEPLVVDRQCRIQRARLSVPVRAVGALDGQRAASHATKPGEKRRLRPPPPHAPHSLHEPVCPIAV